MAWRNRPALFRVRDQPGMFPGALALWKLGIITALGRFWSCGVVCYGNSGERDVATNSKYRCMSRVEF